MGKSIHSSDISHNALKPQNVLISNDCSVKISNFMQANNMKNKQTQKQITEKPKRRTMKKKLSRTHRRTTEFQYYNAPEIVLTDSKVVIKEKTASDLWSVGMIFAELLKMQTMN